ncbi:MULTISPECIES: beta-1,6-N-acetylglucosaminyltransferase [unclassified Enterococcus]|uniref:beta-1,6-N-acetylglucosaminyltransferase n=1 Tax=unclassified Enterococcus TaxID=2608891 RepID=UPI0013ED4BCE|nr:MULTISPECIES: beta-1,6-N-acetylglucosaminyltransferase [unclassified Enterococcus]
MEICYLILAYNDIENLKRLIDRLNKNAVFFIHIDKKTNIEPFIQEFKLYKNVNFLRGNDRVKIYWGGFSIVQAEINLVLKALQNGKYLKYVLLSGADYPIKDNEYIYNYFKKNQSIEFIRGINLDNLDHKEFYAKHIDVYQKHDYPMINKNNTIVFKTFRAMVNRFLRLVKLPPKIRHHKFDLYHGSQWWALSKECLEELMTMYKDNEEDYLNFKIGMFASDEKFFHTLFFNSSYKNENVVHGPDEPLKLRNVEETPLQTSRLANIHIIDPSMNKWFDERDFNQIKKSDKLFVRKVKSGYSDKLLNKIDNEILKVGSINE